MSEPTFPAILFYDSITHGKRRFLKDIEVKDAAMKLVKPVFTYEPSEACKLLDKVGALSALALTRRYGYHDTKVRSADFIQDGVVTP